MIDVDLASEGIACVAILQLDKESFVGTVHVSMVEKGFLQLEANTSRALLALGGREETLHAIS